MIYCQAFISHTIEQSQRTAALACTGAKLLSALRWPKLVKDASTINSCQLFKLVNNMSPTLYDRYFWFKEQIISTIMTL